MERREFIKGSVVGTVAMGVGWMRDHDAVGEESEQPASEAELKLGSQESRIPGASLREKVLKIEEWGGVGLELHGSPRDRIQEIQEAIQGTSVEVSALCWGSMNGDLVSMDQEKRATGIAAMKEALSVAGELRSSGVIFVPCFHKQSELTPEELDQVLLDILPELGEHAQACGTRVLLEPLNRMETFYINRLEQAVAICEQVNHPGIRMMGDFYHMGIEEKDDEAAFVEAGPWLHHVHLASKKRFLPGQDERSFVEGFRGLKRVGYKDHCSLECGVRKGTDPEEEIPKAFRFLMEQWRQAVI